MKMQNVEDIYPLSAMQQGLLFHARSAPESALYFEQWACVFRGDLDVPAFQRAWQRVIDRHTPLRTFFLWDALDAPLQVVRPKVDLPWEQQDWRELSHQGEHLEALLLADQARGFDLTRAPLMRLQLIRMTDDTHQFIWSFHHVLLDGWSIALIFNEIVACYAAFCQGQEPQLESRRPYRAYIAWLQQQDLARAELFWRQALKGFSAPTPLTVDRPQLVGANRQAYAYHEIALPSAALQAFARAQQLTLSTLVQGAWALLLSRYSGEPDVLFGVVVAGRPASLPDAEAMVGLFVNTLPARVLVPPDAQLLPWLHTFQDQQIEARQYEYSPLVQVQGWSDVRRGLPLFESLVTFENYPADGFTLQSPTGTVAVSDAQIIERTNYPLTISIIPGEQLVLKFMYDTGRFDDAAVSRLAGHFQTLLESMVAGPQQRLAEVGLLTAAERQQIVAEWNATQQAYPQHQYLHTIIEAQVEQTPDAIALVFADTQLTYRELNRRANQLAQHLRKLGVGPDTLVGISMERSLELVVGLLGILKAGGAYVPLDPTYPHERLAFMLEDSQTPILLTQRHLVETLTAATGTRNMICLDSDWPAIVGEPDENLTNMVGPENLAYMIYTSGSTGKPKGAMNTHAAISNRLLWMQDAYQLTAADRILQKTPFSFDVSVWEFFWPLMTGARLVVAKPGGHQDSAYLVRLIAEQQVTTLHFVPSMLQIFLEEPQLERCASLKRVICSGEALPFDLQERFFARLDAELHNLYGPTEAAVDVTFWACDPASELRIVPIGRPIANTQMYILDAKLQPVPIGVAGELHIGGIGLARGYLNRPELTNEKFIRNPFGETGDKETRRQGKEIAQSAISNRLYKTGDLARFLPDGNIEYLGRIDHQVKLRGFRIELGEIEAVLRQHAAIADAVVAVREDVPGDKRLVAYIVASQEVQASLENGSEALRSFLKERLPEYMVPSAFMTIAAIPVSPNGKADRRALPAPELPRLQLNAGYAAPQTAIERTIATIWQEVLHVDTVGLHDNFFDLGGHSLLAARVYSKLREGGVGDLSMVDLFQYPTVSSLARYLSQPPAAAPSDAADEKLKQGRNRLQQLRQRQRV